MSLTAASRLFLLAGFLPALLHGNACRDLTTGVWSSPSTWTACGGVVPGAGDTVTIVSHTITLNQSVTGIHTVALQGPAAAIVTNGLAPYTFAFGSTGSDPVGTGTTTAPNAATATQFGFLLCAGTLNLTAPDNAHAVTVTTTGTSPTYIAHPARCGGLTKPAVFRTHYTVLNNLGSAITSFQGVDFDASAETGDIISMDHTYCTNSYRCLIAIAVPNIVFSSNTASGITGNSTVSLLLNDKNATVKDNTELNAVADGAFVRFTYDLPDGFTGSGNAFIRGAAGFSRAIFEVYASSVPINPSLFQYNLGDYTGGGADGFSCVYFGYAGVGETIDRNMSQHAYQAITFAPLGTTVTVSNNWSVSAAETVPGQGQLMFPLNASGTSTIMITGNVVANDSMAGGSAVSGIFCYNGLNGSCQLNRNTVHLLDNTSLGGQQVSMGEPGYPTGPSLVKNTVTTNGYFGIYDFAANTWGTSCAGGVGACNNNVYNAGKGGAYPTVHTSTGFSDGVNPQQAGNYGNIAVNPQYVDVTRRFATFDALAGGPGTSDHLFTQLAARSGMTGVTYDPNFDPVRIYNYLMAGFAPRAIALATAADDGSYVGAVKPVCIGCVIP